MRDKSQGRVAKYVEGAITEFTLTCGNTVQALRCGLDEVLSHKFKKIERDDHVCKTLITMQDNKIKQVYGGFPIFSKHKWIGPDRALAQA